VLLLFRLTRRAFGVFTAFAVRPSCCSLPTLFAWSISLLKESFLFRADRGGLAAVWS